MLRISTRKLQRKQEDAKVDLGNFSNMFDFIMAICYREHGAEFLDVSENIQFVKKPHILNR